VFGDFKYPGVPEVKVHQIDKDQAFTIDGVLFTPVEVMHYKLPVLGYRVGEFTYVTDANYISEQEVEKIKGSKVLVINALRKRKHISHFNLEEALEFIERINPERAYLIHISHLLGKHEEVSKELPDNVFLAYDGLKIKI
jgi:phosphoribosyl 1,2-cyclic phosphate phosphodiesterase